MNVHSIRNKTTYMSHHIALCKYDIAVLCETWLNATDESDQVCVNEWLPNVYIIERADRNTGQTGGGLAIIYKEHLKLKFKKRVLISIRMYDRDNKHLQQPHNNMCSIPTSTITTKWTQYTSLHD